MQQNARKRFYTLAHFKSCIITIVVLYYNIYIYVYMCTHRIYVHITFLSPRTWHARKRTPKSVSLLFDITIYKIRTA